ncbi:hypothetical protein BDK51DRAFT_33396, partial [Blyttiomyces helicus]
CQDETAYQSPSASLTHEKDGRRLIPTFALPNPNLIDATDADWTQRDAAPSGAVGHREQAHVGRFPSRKQGSRSGETTRFSSSGFHFKVWTMSKPHHPNRHVPDAYQASYGSATNSHIPGSQPATLQATMGSQSFDEYRDAFSTLADFDRSLSFTSVAFLNASCPISIARTKEVGLLLCYNEFGFCVDKEGRRLRPKFRIVWTASPVAFVWNVNTGDLEQFQHAAGIRALNVSEEFLHCVFEAAPGGAQRLRRDGEDFSGVRAACGPRGVSGLRQYGGSVGETVLKPSSTFAVVEPLGLRLPQSCRADPNDET